MIYEGKVVGYLGEVHPSVADNYSIGEKAYIAVIDILDILEFAGFNHKYTGIAKYPAVTRDLSLVVPHAVLVHRSKQASYPWLILWYSVLMIRPLVRMRSPQ